MPLSHFLFKERLSLLNTIGIFLSFSGVIILVYGNYGFSSFGIDTLEGNIFAFAGGIAAGFYILGGRKMRQQISVLPYAFVVYGIGTIVLLFFCLFFNSALYGIKTFDITIIFLMAVISGVLGHTIYNWSLAHVRASLASVALLGEPIGASLFALVLPWIRESPSLFTVVGGGIILAGIWLTARKTFIAASLTG